MRIKKRLKINFIVAVAASLFILLIFLTALQSLNKVTGLTKISGDIVLNSFEGTTLRNDYLLNSNERAKAQWFSRHKTIGEILESASKKFSADADKKTLNEIIRKHESLGKIFSAIVENREKSKTGANAGAVSREVEARLLSQLNIKVYEEVVLARELLESSRKSRSATIRLASVGAAGLFLVLLSAVLINSWTTGRSITNSIRSLRDSAAVIGEGDLDHVITGQGDDEFVELAEAFNAMRIKLKGSHHELKSEVAERARAEKALSKAYDALELRVQERTSELRYAEQSLRAINETLEQRVAERTAEIHAANASLRNSRKATLNIMEDALAARKRAEEANANLLREAAERKLAEESLLQSREELRRNNDELTRFNTAMIGREILMIDLKKEINKLCEQAGLEPRYSLAFEKDPAVLTPDKGEQDALSLTRGVQTTPASGHPSLTKEGSL